MGACDKNGGVDIPEFLLICICNKYYTVSGFIGIHVHSYSL